MSLPVLLQLANGDVVFGIALNISRDGSFIRMRTRLELGSCVRIVVIEPLGEAIPDYVVLPAVVVHQTSPGIGLMFRGLHFPAGAIHYSTKACEKAAPT